MSLRRMDIRVTGFVQGVLFRQGVKKVAEKLRLMGFVKNEEDGSVKIVAEGEEEALQKLIEWAKLGTEFSQVEKVEVEWGEAKGEFKDFEIQ